MSDTRPARQGRLVLVAHDLSRLATPKAGGLHGHFTAWVSAWEAHIYFCRWGAIVRPPQYRRTVPGNEDRHAPVVTFGSVRIEPAFLVAALRPVQKLAKQALAP